MKRFDNNCLDYSNSMALLCVVLSCFLSCTKKAEVIDVNRVQNRVVNTGVFQISSIEKHAGSLDNYCFFQGQKRVGQAVAIHDKILYRLFNTGVCQTYDIEDVSNPVLLSTFVLGSYGSANPCNCAQFVEQDGDLYLYVAGLRGMCYVEKLTSNSATLIQTISLKKLSILRDSQRLNIIAGDDGYLWMFGSDEQGMELLFAKAVKPSFEEKYVYISESEIVDYWRESDYVYKESVWQGGMIYDGYLFFLFGSPSSDSHLAIYDTSTHTKVNDFNLNDVIDEEPEDCDFFGGYILLAINDGRGYYLIGINNMRRREQMDAAFI